MKYKITKKHIRSVLKEYIDDYAEDLLKKYQPEDSYEDKYEQVEKEFRSVMTDFVKKHAHKFEDGKWGVIGVVDGTLDKYFK